eukprot:CAMPEP_0183745950 /NCGR_PEP_ID=MMETSP0737-20130205/66503_1 /TAXON_ID=385413 /ORGANISM="Thalassiosira miniscula, Strain CCMP1093" /LENGTH=140 /DNA_ID=CAMNT_0025981629 /DNA_START=951 /DNA_END=1374 /DNA_ORIENTATION=-
MELVEEMIGKHQEGSEKKTKKRGPNGNGDDAFPTQSDGEKKSVDSTLSELEAKMNSNEIRHPSLEKVQSDENPHPILEKYLLIDARITSCRHCSKRLLNFGAAVHYHGYHSCSILDDIDANIADQMKQEGAIGVRGLTSM